MKFQIEKLASEFRTAIEMAKKKGNLKQILYFHAFHVDVVGMYLVCWDSIY